MTSKAGHIDIDLTGQILILHAADGRLYEYPVSTSKNGPGEMIGSFCTPRGEHRIRARIGEGEPKAAVFVARRATGEIYNEELAGKYPERDWILSRILWLGGCEPGRNRYGEVDSQRRFIYIHGTPDSEPMGEPASIGCVRMRNDDVIDLFERVKAGTPVMIRE